MAEARVRRIKEITVERKGKETKTKRKERDYVVHLDKLDEEGGAQVGRSRSIQQGSSLEFGEYKISIQDTATVSLRCKQNLKHIKLANKICCQLRDEFLLEDFKDSGKLMKKLMAAAPRTRKS